MAFYEVHGTDHNGKDFLLGTGESAALALGQLKAARLSKMSARSPWVMADGVAIDEVYLRRRARGEGNA